MRRLILSTVLAVLACSTALASGPAAGQVPVMAAQIQSMQINQVLRMKATKELDFSTAGLKAVKQGDEVEVRKLAVDKIEVKHLGTGQTGVMPLPK